MSCHFHKGGVDMNGRVENDMKIYKIVLSIAAAAIMIAAIDSCKKPEEQEE